MCTLAFHSPITGVNGQWREVTDVASGKLYYYNPVTSETAWTLPAGAALEHASQA